MNVYQKISELSKNFPTICIFRPNARKSNAGFLKFVENRLINAFLLFSQEILESFLRNSQTIVFFVKMRKCLT